MLYFSSRRSFNKITMEYGSFSDVDYLILLYLEGKFMVAKK